MKEQRITIEIGPDGHIAADAEGFSGGTCLGELEKLLKELAPGQATVQRKPDDSNARLATQRTQSAGRKP